MKYGKLIENKLVTPDNPLEEQGRWILNPTEKELKELGYKEVLYNNLPEKKGFYQAIDNYKETEKTIEVNHKYEAEEIMPEPTPEEVERMAKTNKERFLKDFIVTPYGCIRMKTKIGDFVAIMPNITMMVQVQGKCLANTFVLYPEPDYTQYEQCTEEYLVAHQFGNKEMTLEEYNKFVQVVATEYQKLFRGV